MTRVAKQILVAVIAVIMLLGVSNSAYALAPSAPPKTGSGISDAFTAGSIGASDEIAKGGASGRTTGTGFTRAASTSFTCSTTAPSVDGEIQSDTGSPTMLTGIVWTGSGSASCTIAMASISYTVFAVDPQSGSHTIAAGSCTGCSQATAVSTGYTCTQGTAVATNCAGPWQYGYRAVLTAPSGWTFSSGTGSCTAAGTVMTCTATGYLGNAPLFGPTASACTTATNTVTRQPSIAAAAACYNLPPSGNVQLDLEAIKGIRGSHFPGGSKADNTKGLFLSTITNRDLGKIVDTGLKDTGPWTLNASNYYEKTFPYSGVGNRSITFGNGLPSTKVTIVVAKFADPDTGLVDVITMYPADA
jgi:hypothetical protein